jgi:hypothetical protein
MSYKGQLTLSNKVGRTCILQRKILVNRHGVSNSESEVGYCSRHHNANKPHLCPSGVVSSSVFLMGIELVPSVSHFCQSQVNGQLTFQVNMLHNKNASNWSDWLQKLEAHTDQFRIRGVIHAIKKDTLVVHVKQNVKANKTPNFEFDVEVRGEVDSLGVGQFVEVFARRTGYVLEIESVELMEDVPSPSIAWAR